MDATLLVWAKTARGANREGDLRQEASFHPLQLHMIDTAEAARAIWQRVLAPAVRKRWAHAWGLEVEQLESVVALLSGSHDLGKASPPFQAQWAPAVDVLRRAGLRFPRPVGTTPHGIVTASELAGVLVEAGCSPSVADHLAFAVGGHHGAFPAYQDVDLLPDQLSEVGDAGWDTVRRALFENLASVEDAESGLTALAKLAELPAWTLVCLAGLTTVADWIASDAAAFPPQGRLGEVFPNSLVSYRLEAQVRAWKALDSRLWTSPTPRVPKPSFAQLFPFDPNPLQIQIGDLADKLAVPALIIIEAPMGQGKSEAALYAASLLSRSQGRDGLYFALPTEATSNQMFRRLVAYLEGAHPDHPVNAQLLHGHASLSADLEVLLRHGRAVLNPTGVGEQGVREVTAETNVLASEWFLPRKRGLLAPFGVGTVDQALLSVLRVRHFFVRLFGLAGKTVIIDEVHAYDAYMVSVLTVLLEWLGQMGTSVILLSATLPARRAAELSEAFAKGAGVASTGEPPARPPSYPRVTWVEAGQPPLVAATPRDPSTSRVFHVRWIAEPDDPGGLKQLGQSLAARLASGGCAAVICNTVSEAQRVYRALNEFFTSTDAGDGEPELTLFHAQFPMHRRLEIEGQVLARFGKVGEDGVNRPHRAVLVATQVIEQSLDLDFDLMVTQMAPVDLVLQRAGRLWRHRATPRPVGCTHPEIWIWERPRTDGSPEFPSGDLRVYDEYILLRSWLALRDRERVRVPEDVEALIESVYGDVNTSEPLPQGLQRRLNDAKIKLERKRERYEAEARRRLVEAPRGAWELFMGEPQLQEPEDDHQDVNPALQGLTRIGPPSAMVILVRGTVGGSWYTPGRPNLEVNRQEPPSIELVKQLLEWSVRITHQGVVRALKREDTLPASWRRSLLLRGCRVLVLDDDLKAQMDDWTVRFDPRLGLVIEGSS